MPCVPNSLRGVVNSSQRFLQFAWRDLVLVMMGVIAVASLCPAHGQASPSHPVVSENGLPTGAGGDPLGVVSLAGLPAHLLATGVALVNGGNHEGVIAVGQEDEWTFSAATGDEIYLRAGELSGGFFEPWIRLYDPNGVLIQEANSANDSLIIYRVLVAGKHTVLVSSGELGQTGTYRLHYLKTPGSFVIPNGDEGGPLHNGRRQVGKIELGDVDPWTFEAGIGDEIYLRAGELSGGFFEPWLRVYDPNGF